jgi:hypothetical protein
MSIQYHTLLEEQQEKERVSQHLAQQLEAFLEPLLTCLDLLYCALTLL